MSYTQTKETTKVLQQIYECEDVKKYEARILNLEQKYKEVFNTTDIKDTSICSVAGRIEVGGNHTDHQLGKVLCASINLDTLAVCAKTDDNLITIHSEGYEPISIDISSTEIVKSEENSTLALVRGVANKLKEDGHKIGGFNAVVTSTVFSGSGMSSSASFEGLIGSILNNFYCNNEVDLVEIAKIGQYAENVYFGKLSGLMDQIACILGGFVFIDFYDKENPVIEKIDSSILSKDYDVCVIATGDSHDDLTSEYSDISIEMGRVAKFFNETYLSRVDENEFYSKIPEIRKQVGDRAIVRAIHFFEDNRHVELQKNALKSNDLDTFFKLIKQSGRSSVSSLQNIFSGKEPEVQGASIVLALCHRLLGEKGGYRIHGGGFGGTVQAFVPKEMTQSFKKEMEAIMGEGSCHIVSVRGISAICF